MSDFNLANIAPSNILVSGLGGAAGYGEITVPHGDDDSFEYDISTVFENGFNFFGHSFQSMFVNTNGNITFGGGVSTHIPLDITGDLGIPMIAPFWADVDTREHTGTSMYLDLDPIGDVVTVTWPGVPHFPGNQGGSNAFQLQLFDRGGGEADIVFRYQEISWTIGSTQEEDPVQFHARAGYTANDGLNFFELPQSGDEGQLIDLPNTPGNTGVDGLWVFHVDQPEGETGGPGNDTFSGGVGADVYDGRGGNDSVSGGNGGDFLSGGDGQDTLNGGNGADSLFGDAGDDTLNGGNQRDFLDGGSGNDTLNGGNDDDVLRGEAGNDNLFGNNGDDRLGGGEGNDTLNGGNGSDILEGASGNDSLTGGSNADHFIFRAGFGSDTVNDFQVAGFQHDNLHFETSLFTGAADLLAHAAGTAGGVLITSDAGDTLLLKNVTFAQLQAHPEDLHFA